MNIEDQMTEAEYLSMNDDYYDDYEDEYEEFIHEPKLYYVITCIGNKSKRKVYLQDRNKSKNRWWTYFIESALLFKYEKAAKDFCNKLKYNNCKVEKVYI